MAIKEERGGEAWRANGKLGPLLRVSGDVTWHGDRRLRPPLKADIRLMTARHGHGNLINCLQISWESVDIKRDRLNIMNVPGAAPEEGQF